MHRRTIHNSLRSSLNLIFAATIAIAATACAPSGAQTRSELPSEGGWFQLMVPAGPFSVVNTSTGSLITTIPLVALSGPGGMGFDVSLTHISSDGSREVDKDGQVARNWRHTYDEWLAHTVDTGAHFVQRNSASGNLSEWFRNGGTGAYTRRDGLHDVVDDTNPSTYYVSSKDSRSKASYVLDSMGDHRISQISDLHGNHVDVAYDNLMKRALRVTDASGFRSATFTYNPGNLFVMTTMTLSTPGGSRTWSFFTDASNHLTDIFFPPPMTGASSPRIHFTYDADGNITDLYDLKGNHWHYQYAFFDIYRRVSAVYDPYQLVPVTFDFVHDVPNGQWIATITDQLGRSTRHKVGDYTIQWFFFPIEQVVDPIVTGDPSAFVSSFTSADGFRDLTSYGNPRGYLRSWFYDSNNWGDVQFVVDTWRGETSQFLYNSNHLVIRSIDPQGHRALYTYTPVTLDLQSVTEDPKHDPNDLTFNNPNGAEIITKYTYDYRGNVASIQTGADPPTFFSSDSYGNVSTVVDPRGQRWTATHDSFNNLRTINQPDPGGTERYVYDLWNRLTTVIHADSSRSFSTYDFMSNLTSATDENGHVSYFDVDSLNRVFRTREQAAGQQFITTSTRFNAAGDQISVTNGRGMTTQYFYDERGLPIKLIYPDQTTRRAHYNGNGFVDRQWDGRGKLSTLAYDGKDRLTKITYPTKAPVTFTYDYDGLRKTMTDGTTSSPYTWTHNGAHLLTSCFQPIPNKTINYSYDSSGRRMAMQMGGQTWNYSYDGASNLTSVKDLLSGGSALFTYRGNGLVSQKSVMNGVKTSYLYDQRNRPTEVLHQFATKVQQQVNYVYDSVGNVQSTVDISPLTSEQWTSYFTYDALNRLQTEQRIGAPGHGFDLNTKYQYDANGNRQSVSRKTSVSQYIVDPNDKFLSGDGFYFGNYDLNGNPGTVTLVGCGTYYLTYDDENQLLLMTLPPGSKTGFNRHIWNGDGQRVGKQDSTGTTYFVYDGVTVIAETNAQGGIKKYYTPGVGFVSPSNGQKGFFEENALGSTLAVADETGLRQSRYLYDAFGVTITLNQPNGWFTPFQFVGGEGYYTEGDCGIILLGHRLYVPMLGRFLNQDPIGQSGGLNLYEYGANNPLSNVDPLGLDNKYLSGFIKGLIYDVAEINDSSLIGIPFKLRQYQPSVWIASKLVSRPQLGSESAGAKDAHDYLAIASILAGTSLSEFGVARSGGLEIGVSARSSYEIGDAAEVALVERIEAGGHEVLGRKVTVRLSNGQNRQLDILVRGRRAQKTINVESKAGPNADREFRQIQGDTLLRKEGGILVGKNAQRAIRLLGTNRLPPTHTKVIRQ